MRRREEGASGAALAAPLCRMAEVMGRMEERERSHEATVLAMEKDVALRQQALETFKRKVRGHTCILACVLGRGVGWGSGRCDDEGIVFQAMDSVQSAQQLQLQVEEEEKVRQQIQESLSRKVEECEHSSQQLRRLENTWAHSVLHATELATFCSSLFSLSTTHCTSSCRPCTVPLSQGPRGSGQSQEEVGALQVP